MSLKKLQNKYKFFFFLPLLFYLGKRSLIAYDEGFYYLQSRWILEKGNWIMPMWFDQVYLDRTIAIQYLLALSQKYFGNSLFTIYLPIAFASLLMLLFTYELHKELIKDDSPIYSSFILSTTFLWINFTHQATQDMIFASIVTLGVLSSIKASKTKNILFFILSGAWIGLSAIFKTYLVVIPFLAIFPFLVKSKIIKNKYFWFGILLGFIPFLLWSYNIIFNYSLETYNGLFEKLIMLSKNNTFTNPFYYYIWNLSINIFPWTILSFLGFLQSRKLNNNAKYFLFIYPLLIIFQLSIFSTKTPYYPLQILPLIAINTYLGIQYIIKNKKNKVIFYTDKFNYFIIPLITFIGILIINFSDLTIIDSRAKILINIGGLSFCISWLLFNTLKKKKQKIFITILGPYLLILMLVQSGLITDRSKALRLASEELIKSENLRTITPKIVKSEITDNDSLSKIIKIMIKMPNIGSGINNLDNLETNEYAWTTSNIDNLENNYYIISENILFKPWKLIRKK